MLIFDKRSLDADKTIDPISVKESIAESPRHEGIDFGDNRLGVAQDTHRDVDRDAKTDEAVRVRRRHLHEGNIGRYATVRRQVWDLGKRYWDIFGLPTMNESAHVRSNEEAAMAISGLPVDPKRLQTRGKEVKQLNVGRGGLAALKGLNQREWRCTSRSDKYSMARLDDLDGRLSRYELVRDLLERRSNATHLGLPVSHNAALAAHTLIMFEREILEPTIA